MRNITVSVDDETLRRCRVYAAKTGTSVEALVREYLKGLTAGRPLVTDSTPEEAERRRRKLDEVIEDIRANSLGFSARENLSREELYDRARARVGMAGYSPAGSSDET